VNLDFQLKALIRYASTWRPLLHRLYDFEIEKAREKQYFDEIY